MAMTVTHLVPNAYDPQTFGPPQLVPLDKQFPNQFSSAEQMVPYQFGPPGQMVPVIFHLSRGTGCGD